MSLSRKTRSRVAFAIAGAILAAISCFGAAALVLEKGGGELSRNPRGIDLSAAASDASSSSEGVDWDYWLSVNPDIIGWVSVPGTNIDYPVVRAPDDRPGYYLDHDVYGKWNFTGCPYLDANSPSLIERGSVVFGHNMGWSDAMFADFSKFSDAGYTEGHREVHIYTPDGGVELSVRAVDVVPGWEKSKRTSFSGERDFEEWWTGRLAASDVAVGGSDEIPDAVVAFCTCSYNYWSSERTLVYAESVE